MVEGLSAPSKALPCRWLYDERGSGLFEDITRVPEYYLTRAETKILQENLQDISDFVGPNAAIVEYGAGAALKTELLLAALINPAFYVPIDISEEFLRHAALRIASVFPNLSVRVVSRDFLETFELPISIPADNRVAFFPGSTMGNLTHDETVGFLRQAQRHVGRTGKAIIGVDLRKDITTLLRAYDDRGGVTAQFNLNLLVRINRELEGNFQIDRFKHEARWNGAESAVEMHIVSLLDQTVSIAGKCFKFVKDETIHTESSRKYDRIGFTVLARCAGWCVDEFWTDESGLFGIFGLGAETTVDGKKRS